MSCRIPRLALLLALCALITLSVFCLITPTTSVEAAASSKSSPSKSTPTPPTTSDASASSGNNRYETDEAKAIRERKEARDAKIAEKKKAKELKEQQQKSEEAAKNKKEEVSKKEPTTAATKKKEEAKKQEEPKKETPKKETPKPKVESTKEEPKKQEVKKDGQKPTKKEAEKKQATKTVETEIPAASQQQVVDAAVPTKLSNIVERPTVGPTVASQRRLEKAQKRSVDLKKRRQDRKKAKRERESARLKKEETRRRSRLESQKPEIIARGAEKLKWFESQVRGGTGKKSQVVDISYTNFKKYVVATPRPYWLFVIFTALGESYRCIICKNVEPEIKTLANVYAAEREKNENSTANAVELREDDFATEAAYDEAKRSQMPIFFVQVDIGSNGEVFRMLSMQSAPTMVVLPPTSRASPPPLANLLTSLPSKNKFPLQRNEISANDLNEFITKCTGRTVALTRQREPGLAGIITAVKEAISGMDPVRSLVLSVAGAMLCLLAVLYLLQTAWRMVKKWRNKVALKNGVTTRELSLSERVPLRIYSQYSYDLLRQSLGTPSLARSCSGVAPPGSQMKSRSLGLFRWWFVVVGCLVYLFGISGGMFNILRGNSSLNFDFLRRPSKFDIWSHIQPGSSHDQSVMEGLMLGTLQLVLASIIIFVNRMSFTQRRVRKEGEPVQAKDRLISIAKWLGNCIFSPLIWLTLAFLTWRLILAIYSKKNGNYHHGFVWKHVTPQHFAFIAKYCKLVLSYLPKFVAQNILRWF